MPVGASWHAPFHVFTFVRYMTTVMREIPFAFIQFPIWEKLKKIWSEKQGAPVAGWQSALCGSLSGGFAAAVTTPLDVAKTRLMLDSTGKWVHAQPPLPPLAAW